MAKKDETAQMARDYRDGKTLKEIGRQYRISPQAVQQRLSSVGMSREDRPPAGRFIDKEQLETLYEKKLSLADIAGRIGTHLGNVKKALKFYRIPKRRRIITRGHRVDILKKLAIGEICEEPHTAGRSYVRIYASAKRVGIKVSVRRADQGKVEITRIE